MTHSKKISRNILFYPSGHGFGHAVRQIEIMKDILARNLLTGTRHRVAVRTLAPEWLFENSFSHFFESLYGRRGTFWRDFFEYHAVENDVGTIQRDSLNMDIPATLARCREFYGSMPARARAEALFIRERAIDAIVGDIPPLAFEAASLTGVPAAGITNFSWDFIYREFVAEHPGFADIVGRIEAAYSKCGILLELPYSCPLPAFGDVRAVPLLARKPYLSREEVLAILGFETEWPHGKPVVMISFGGFDTHGMRLGNLAKLDGYEFITTIPAPRGEAAPPNVKYVDTRVAGLSFENLFRVFDAIVTKPGYGVLGDIVAAGASCIYADRGNFAEYPYLVRMLHECAHSAVFIERDRLMECDLGPYIEKALVPNPAARPVGTDGASACADMILDL